MLTTLYNLASYDNNYWLSNQCSHMACKIAFSCTGKSWKSTGIVMMPGCMNPEFDQNPMQI